MGGAEGRKIANPVLAIASWSSGRECMWERIFMNSRIPDLKVYIQESSGTNKGTLVGVSVFHSPSLIPSLGRPIVFISHTLSKAEINHVSFRSLPRGVIQQVGSHILVEVFRDSWANCWIANISSQEASLLSLVS